eukprot:11235089-Ditylum_brightwellii.AAC.1
MENENVHTSASSSMMPPLPEVCIASFKGLAPNNLAPSPTANHSAEANFGKGWHHIVCAISLSWLQTWPSIPLLQPQVQLYNLQHSCNFDSSVVPFSNLMPLLLTSLH